MQINLQLFVKMSPVHAHEARFLLTLPYSPLFGRGVGGEAYYRSSAPVALYTRPPLMR